MKYSISGGIIYRPIFRETDIFYDVYGVFLLQIMLDNVRCEGSERSITQCRHHDWYKTNCDHYEDAGVKCHAPELQGHQVNNSRTTGWNFVLLTKRQLLSNSLK